MSDRVEGPIEEMSDRCAHTRSAAAYALGEPGRAAAEPVPSFVQSGGDPGQPVRDEMGTGVRSGVISIILLLLPSAMEGGSMGGPPQPKFLVIQWSNEDAQIVQQGEMSQSSFHRHFLDPYALGGERLHPPKDAVVRGLLVARDETTVVTVPILTWKDDGVVNFLCQASEDGSPPEFSAFSHSEKELLRRIRKNLGREKEAERPSAGREK